MVLFKTLLLMTVETTGLAVLFGIIEKAFDLFNRGNN